MLLAVGNDARKRKCRRLAQTFYDDDLKRLCEVDPSKWGEFIEQCLGVVIFGSLTGQEHNFVERCRDAGKEIITH